jgi:hypothetical protein
MSWLGCGTGRLRRTMEYVSRKMAVLTPMPSARVMMATSA